MDEEKKLLRNQTATIYHFSCLKQGLRRLWSNPIKLAVSVVLWVMVCSALYIVAKQDFAPLQNLLLPLWLFAFLSIALLIIYLNGYTFGSYRIYNNLVRAGFVNFAGEAPFLTDRKKDGDSIILTFRIVGIPLNDWEDKKASIEAALNGYIGKIEEMSDRQMFRLVFVKAFDAYQDRAWMDDYIDWQNEDMLTLGTGITGLKYLNISANPHLMIGGRSGSGKSVFLKVLMFQFIKRNQAAGRFEPCVYLVDMKGGTDYNKSWRQLCHLITTEEDTLKMLQDILAEMEHRTKLFLEIGCENIMQARAKGYDWEQLPRLFVVFDEVSQVLGKTSKTDKESKQVRAEIVDCISKLACLSRFAGIHLCLCCQRPDAVLIDGQIRSNLYGICGKADSILSQIVLGTGAADKMIAKHSRGLFVDEQEELFKSFYLNY